MTQKLHPEGDRPTLVPVVLNAIAGLFFLVAGVIAVATGRSWVWTAICVFMVAVIATTTWPMYRRWRDRNRAPLTR